METISKIDNIDSLDVYGSFKKPLFLCFDISKTLGQRNSNDVVRNIDQSEIRTCHRVTERGLQKVLATTPEGIIEALTRSKKDIAKSLLIKVKEYLNDNKVKYDNDLEKHKEKVRLNSREVIFLGKEFKTDNTLVSFIKMIMDNFHLTVSLDYIYNVMKEAGIIFKQGDLWLPRESYLKNKWFIIGNCIVDGNMVPAAIVTKIGFVGLADWMRVTFG